MRGDSLQDLYSKSLALVGLSVLAGIGALVDYWPARLDPPRINAREAAPAIAAAYPVRPVEIPMPRLTRAADAAPVAILASTAGTKPDHGIPVAVAFADASAAAVSDFGAPPTPVSPAMTMTAADPLAPISSAERYVDEVALSRMMAPSMERADNSSDDGGFLSSATGLAKKAGSSIVSGSTRAGVSIMDGLSFVGRKIKKLKFF